MHNDGMAPLSEQLRFAILSSSKSLRSLAKESQASRNSLSRFANGRGGLSLRAIDALGIALGIRLAPTGNGDSNE